MDLTRNYRIVKVNMDVFVETFNLMYMFIKRGLMELEKIEIDEGTMFIYLYCGDERIWDAMLDILTAMGIGFGID